MNEYEKELKQFDDNLIKPNAVAPLVIIASGIISVSYLFGQTFSKNPYVVWGTVAALVIFTLTNFIPKLQFSKAHKTYLTLYHLTIMGVVIFIMPILTSFLLFWIVLTYVSQYYYKRVGQALSLFVLALTLFVGIRYQQVPLNTENLLIAAGWFLALMATSSVFSSIVQGTFQNRGLLASKMVRAEYEHQRILSLINSMAEAVIATDENGIISIYNSAAMELLNTNTGLDNQKIDSILRLSDINHKPVRLIDYAKSLKKSVAKVDFYLDLSQQDRRTISIDISRTILFSPISQQKGYTFLLNDVTEEKSLSKERDDFVSVVSHELRTPIAIAEANTAMAQLQAKKAGISNGDIDKSLDNAHKQIVFLSEMINDLATLSKAETAKNKLEIEEFGIDDVLKELDMVFRPKAREKGLDFTINAQSDLPLVDTSRLYVKDILQNFISNAIKYTNNGSVEVRASAFGNNMIRFDIKDTGVGLTKAEMGQLFQKFWRSEDLKTRETEGTGLGLYIAAKLARQIGAKIEVSSTKDQGSTFSVLIPIKVSQKDISAEIIQKNNKES